MRDIQHHFVERRTGHSRTNGLGFVPCRSNTGYVDNNGVWYPHNANNRPTNNIFEIKLVGSSKDVYDKPVPGSNGVTYNGKQFYFFPLQQNGGDAKFDIKIGPSGVVLNSRIVSPMNSSGTP